MKTLMVCCCILVILAGCSTSKETEKTHTEQTWWEGDTTVHIGGDTSRYHQLTPAPATQLIPPWFNDVPGDTLPPDSTHWLIVTPRVPGKPRVAARINKHTGETDIVTETPKQDIPIKIRGGSTSTSTERKTAETSWLESTGKLVLAIAVLVAVVACALYVVRRYVIARKLRA